MSVYLIDGYNLLHALLRVEGRGIEGRIPPDMLEDERRRLVDRVASFMGSRHDKAIVVFDAHRSNLQKAESAAKNVEVFFGSFTRSADAIIEREAYSRSEKEDIIVVTSDYGLQKTIFRPNVIRRSSTQFVSDLGQDAKEVAKPVFSNRIGHRVEDRLDAKSLERLKALRDGLSGEGESK